MKITKCFTFLSALTHALVTGEISTWDSDQGVFEIVKTGARKYQVVELVGGERRVLKTREINRRF